MILFLIDNKFKCVIENDKYGLHNIKKFSWMENSEYKLSFVITYETKIQDNNIEGNIFILGHYTSYK